MASLLTLRLPEHEAHRRRGLCGSRRAAALLLLVSNAALLVVGAAVTAAAAMAASAYMSTSAATLIAVGAGALGVGLLGTLAVQRFTGLLYLVRVAPPMPWHPGNCLHVDDARVAAHGTSQLGHGRRGGGALPGVTRRGGATGGTVGEIVRRCGDTAALHRGIRAARDRELRLGPSVRESR